MNNTIEFMPPICALLARFSEEQQEKLKHSLTLLLRDEISYEENKWIYLTIFNNYEFAHELAVGFCKLASADIAYSENTQIYEMVVRQAPQASFLSSSFVSLKVQGLFYLPLLQALLDAPTFASILLQAFIVLKNAGFAYEEYPELYRVLIKVPGHSSLFVNNLIRIKRVNILNSKDHPLYASFMKLVENSLHIHTVADGFCKLIDHDILYPENAELYDMLLQNPILAANLAHAFGALIINNISLASDKELFYEIRDCKESTEYAMHTLAVSYVMLKRSDISYNENGELYIFLRKSAREAIDIAKLFITLKRLNLSFKDYPEIYEAYFKHPFTTSFEQAFLELKNYHQPYNKEDPLYMAILNAPYHAGILASAFCELLKGEFSYLEHTDLFEELINSPGKSITLSINLNALAAENISYTRNARLCHIILKKWQTGSIAHRVVEALKQIGIEYAHCPVHFNEYILITHDLLVVQLLKQLIDAGFLYKTHHKVLDKLLTMLSVENITLQVVLNMVNELCTYNKRMSAHSEKLSECLLELDNIIERNLATHITFGPLNKSKATVHIERILERICKEDVENEKGLFFISPETYLLSLRGCRSVNLSLLIKNANLTHLILSDKLIEEISVALGKLLKIDWNNFNFNKMSKAVERLPIAQQKAIVIYTGEHYKNINKLFRSEPLNTSIYLHQNPGQNLLAYFLIGCLLNDAANKLKLLPDEFRFQHAEEILDRGEKITAETILARTQNAWVFPALTSFSLFKNGSSFFQEPKTIRTKMHGASNEYVINEEEGEVIFAQGEQVMTVQGHDSLVSSIKRSPTLDPKNHYMSHLALFHAFERHLSYEYAEESSAITVNSKNIVRPNHGMPHTYRMMLLIELVLQYFAHYARDEDFKSFCQVIDDEEIEWLLVASAFSITGRESELSAMNDLNRYDNYRAKCREHFLYFVDIKATHIPVPIRERMAHIIRYMGNPNYETRPGQLGINKHPKRIERQLRNFTHRILTIAHKIDLVRCYNADDFSRAMQLCHDLAEKSEAQANAFAGLVRYIVELNKAHGNKLDCDIGLDGKLFTVNLPYQDIFSEVSLSMKRLFEVSQTVKRPLITQQFEYSGARAMQCRGV